MQKKINIKDIAREAGVAVSTASMALSGNEKIKLKTRQRLREVAERLGYVPNMAARNLVGGKTFFIGMVIMPSQNNIYLEEAIAVQRYLIAHEYKFKLFIADINNKEEQDFLLQSIRGIVDGIICYPVPPALEQQFIRKLQNYGIKCVFTKFIKNTAMDWVSADYELGAYLGTNYLLKKGHRRIATFTSGDDQRGFPERASGVRRALEEYNLEFQPFVITPEMAANMTKFSGGYDLAKEMLSAEIKPTALFMRSDFLALGAIKAATDMNLRIGHDIDIVGFDNIEFGAFSVPALTTIKYDRDEKAKMMAELLLRRVKGEEFPPKNIFIKPELVIRESA
mgnify:CR=1 FL=1